MILSREGPKLDSPKDVFDHLIKFLTEMDVLEQEKEHFFLVALDVKNQVKCIDLIATGILNGRLVHPREIFRRAIQEGALSIIVCHNHPSGNSEPSQEDKKLTKSLKEAGEIIGIKLLDHIIIGDSFFSFQDSGLL